MGVQRTSQMRCGRSAPPPPHSHPSRSVSNPHLSLSFRVCPAIKKGLLSGRPQSGDWVESTNRLCGRAPASAQTVISPPDDEQRKRECPGVNLHLHSWSKADRRAVCKRQFYSRRAAALVQASESPTPRWNTPVRTFQHRNTSNSHLKHALKTAIIVTTTQSQAHLKDSPRTIPASCTFLSVLCG